MKGICKTDNAYTSVKALRPHRIDFKHGYSVDRYKLIGEAIKALKNDSGAFEW